MGGEEVVVVVVVVLVVVVLGVGFRNSMINKVHELENCHIGSR